MVVYVIEGIGGIEVDFLERGDMTVKYVYTEAIHAILHPFLVGKGRYVPEFYNWIIFAQHSETVLANIERVAQRIT
ncbi:MAG: hypothetical protein NVSMB6_00670 [Burkholderiaceae bacterium]